MFQAFVLGEYLTQKVILKNKFVLELGAGTGLVGMIAAAMGANVTCTDVGKSLPILKDNIDLNFPTLLHDSIQLTVQELEWGKFEHFKNCRFNYDYILGADIIYLEETFDPLVKTLGYLAKCNKNKNATKILLSTKLRYDCVEHFFKKLKTIFSTIKQVFKNFDLNIVIYECY